MLQVLVGLPLVAALTVGTGPLARRRRLAGWTALAAATVALALAGGVYAAARGNPDGFVERSRWTWISSIDVQLSFGVDWLSAPLVLVTAILTWCCLLALLLRTEGNAVDPPLCALVLLVEGASIGTFAALDLIVFFVFFELVLIPMWFVIADWGDADDPAGRRAAATRFLVVTVTGSALVLIAFLLLHRATGTFDIPTLLEVGASVPRETQLGVAILLMVGFGAKVPVWPLHIWLPDAHSKAPTVGSVLLAGVLLKLGTYGLLRFWSPVIPWGARQVSPYLAAFGVAGILYAALVCLGQRDIKRLIAYSSVGHMGFVLLAISTLSRPGRIGANFANVAHALITGLLFFIVGAVKVRAGGTSLDDIGRGLYGRAPKLAALLAFGAVASLGLPGLAGFWGEMLAMLSAFSPAAALPSGLYVGLMVLAGLGVVLTTAYFVRLIRQVCQAPPELPAFADVAAAEWVPWAPLALLTVILGLAPGLLAWGGR